MMGQPYDKSLPLFFLHVGKCGGVSVLRVLQEWFQGDFYLHYLNGPMYSLKESIVVGGHFERRLNMGIEQIYPSAQQKITIIRDPFDVAVSKYFYFKSRKAMNPRYIVKPTLKMDLERSLTEKHNLFFDFLPQYQADMCIRQYVQNQFLYIGLFEHLQSAVNRLALILEKPPIALPHFNLSVYDEPIPDLRLEFKKTFSLEYEFYEYVKELHHLL